MLENEFRVSALTEQDVIGLIDASEQEKGQIDINQYIGHDQPYFINTLMRHYAEKNASSDTALNEAIANKVTQFVRDICGELQNTMFAGEITPCGSVAEGTKIGDFDEFDFIYEILDMSVCSNKLIATKILPETFRSKNRNVTSGEKSFFTLNFRNEVSDEWQQFMKCKECDSPESCSPEHEGRFIHSQSVQAAFMEAIRSKIPGIQDISQERIQFNTSTDQTTHNYETSVDCSSEMSLIRYDINETALMFIYQNTGKYIVSLIKPNKNTISMSFVYTLNEITHTKSNKYTYKLFQNIACIFNTEVFQYIHLMSN